MPSKQSAKKPGWVVVASRVPPDFKDKIKQRYPDNKLTDVIYSLLDHCIKGKILGLKIQTFQ